METLSKDGMITTKNKEKMINKTADFKENYVAYALDRMNANSKKLIVNRKEKLYGHYEKSSQWCFVPIDMLLKGPDGLFASTPLLA